MDVVILDELLIAKSMISSLIFIKVKFYTIKRSLCCSNNFR